MFHLSVCLITFGDGLDHLISHVHKSDTKTAAFKKIIFTSVMTVIA